MVCERAIRTCNGGLGGGEGRGNLLGIENWSRFVVGRGVRLALPSLAFVFL